jgi:hypothetical protein
MGHTENKILQAKMWQKPNTCQLNCGSQTLAWQNVARNQTPPNITSVYNTYTLGICYDTGATLSALKYSWLFQRYPESNPIIDSINNDICWAHNSWAAKYSRQQ